MTEAKPEHISADRLKTLIHGEAELALIDVREHGQYGEDHLFFAVPIAYSELETRIVRLVPNRGTQIVLYGDRQSTEAVTAAATALLRLGYRDVAILEGGIEAWKKAGYSTFAGVHVPSKTFGELAEHAYGTPHLSAEQLRERLAETGRQVIVLDGRPLDEYRKMSIPGAICCPNGELAFRVGALAPDPETEIVVNCAGRTRSIIGAQTLINLGIPNPVYALENGTQGWYLADYPLERQADRRYPDEVADEVSAASRDRAQALARRFSIAMIDAAKLRSWWENDGLTVFVLDIRTEEEFVADRFPSSVRHAPGGQLLQATDQYVGTRNSRIVLYDGDGIRAPVVASWLKQLGWQVFLISDRGALSDLPEAPDYRPVLKRAQFIEPALLRQFLEGHPETVVLDARPSQEFRKSRLRGATWVIRPTLMETVKDDRSENILLLGEKREKLELLAEDLERAGFAEITLAVANGATLTSLGLPMDEGADGLLDEACIDFLFFVHDRHEGNKVAARQYLEWETNLVSRLDPLEAGSFSIGDTGNSRRSGKNN
ncbi:rhodanese-like domain-containing protein [Pararhizobium mangrovi]|uniref:Sulfurtransferase n=1 Tax=Pararhizobium mangrovi TaxID=2590452 RepID=A0A506U289_9HYPH|nr:rhodanese-like domain-containing protein [Pararhizobium mangrovi]TPW25987.1 sulfurtransferase [Pararhizobium mangrovi]